jgi:hypothetical protein
MKAVMAALLGCLMGGCSLMKALDFDGDPEKSFEFRFGWDRGIETSKAKPGKTDDHGVYQPETAGADAILRFPGVSAGFAVEIQPDARITPTIGVEAFRFKTPVPYMRWWIVQVGAGAQLADVYVGKLLVPIVDLTVGPWVGWDFETDDVAWGLQGTIFKF